MKKLLLLGILAMTMVGCTSQPVMKDSKNKSDVLSGNDVNAFALRFDALVSTGDHYTYSDSTVTITGK